jgi:SPX domain protein involved in polyphosphate accumulation
VNNVYLDSLLLDNYCNSVRGVADRVKVRIRWYGPALDEVHDPRLETKSKCGLVGWKEVVPLPQAPTHLAALLAWTRQGWPHADLGPGVRERVLALSPTLINSYRRMYFVSGSGKVRLTLDTDLEYTRVHVLWHSALEKVREQETTIVELKYDVADEDRIDQVSSLFPFRVTRSSKYIMGLDRLQG